MTLIRNIILAISAFVVMGMAAPAFAKTVTEIDACADAALAAEPFTGTAAERERQARSLAVGTTVLIGEERVALRAGETIWSRCSGPSVAEQLTAAQARITELERAITAKDTRIGELTELAYVRTGEDELTWRDNSAAWQQVAEDARADATFATVLLLIIVAIIVALVIAAIFLNRKKPARRQPEPTADPVSEEPEPMGSER